MHRHAKPPQLRLLFVACFLFTFLGSLQAQERIVSCAPNHTEILYELEAGGQLVGVTEYCDHPDKVLADKKAGRVKIVGGFLEMDADLIVSLKPTLVLTATSLQEKIRDDLAGRGLRVVHYDPVTLEDVFAMIEELGEKVGKGSVAKQLTGGYRDEIGAIKEKSEKVSRLKVYFEINHQGPVALGAGSPMNEIVQYAGGENIFNDIPQSAFVADHSEIIRRNPDVILTPLWPGAGRDDVTTIAEIVSRKGYNTTNAVMNSRVYFYDSSLLKREGPRQVLAIKKLAYLLHPDVFENPEGTVPWELGKIK